MDKERLAVLEAGVKEQLNLIKQLHGEIKKKINNFKSSPEAIDSMAYKLHNLYCAYEELFEIVADFFENQIEGIRYHINLLRRMKLYIEGIRPNLLSEDVYLLLDELRKFRHFFRHAYGVKLDSEKVERVAEIAIKIESLFEKDLNRFLNSFKG